jgi:hypothetical protein
MERSVILSVVFSVAISACGGDAGTGDNTDEGSGGSPGPVADAALDVSSSVGGSTADAKAADHVLVDTIAPAPDVRDAAGASHVGTACSTTTDCTPDLGSGLFCSADGLSSVSMSPGTKLPDPACVSLGCTRPATGIPFCDNGHGYCQEWGTDPTTFCFPLCVSVDGAAVVGCTGKDACNSRWSTADSNGVRTGYGFCYGGCTSDADCKGGDFCQKESGYCDTTLLTYTKQLGEFCTSNLTDCWCHWGAGGVAGYCTQFCRTGDAAAACPAGFACDPELGAITRSGQAITRKISPGLGALCLQNCSTDADCPGVGMFKCWASAGMTQKACHSYADPRVPPDSGVEAGADGATDAGGDH